MVCNESNGMVLVKCEIHYFVKYLVISLINGTFTIRNDWNLQLGIQFMTSGKNSCLRSGLFWVLRSE